MRFTKYLVIVVMCMYLMSVTGCGTGDTENIRLGTTTQRNETEELTAKPLPGTLKPGVLVTVNGVDITQKQLDDRIKPQFESLTKQAANLPPAFLKQRKMVIRNQTLQEMIEMQLWNEKVEAANITVTEQEITDEIARVAAAQKHPAIAEEFKRKMQNYGFDKERTNSKIRTMLGQHKLMAKKFPDEAKFTEEDAKAYYEANKTRYTTPEQIRASHILIRTAPSNPNSDPKEAKAVARAKAEDILKQVKEGADFAALAKTPSQGPSATRGGDLDFFHRAKMVKPFSDAAFGLKEIGDVSEIVETLFGFHIIKLTGKKEAKTTSFEETKDGIMREQTQKKLQDLANKYAEKLKADAKIVYAPGMEPPGIESKPAEPLHRIFDGY